MRTYKYLFGGSLDWLKPPAGRYPLDFDRAFKEHPNHLNLFIYDEYENLIYTMDPKNVKNVFWRVACRINTEHKIYSQSALADMNRIHGPYYALETVLGHANPGGLHRFYVRLEQELLTEARKLKRRKQ